MATFVRLAGCYDGNCPAFDLQVEPLGFRVTGDKVGEDGEGQVDIPPEVVAVVVAELTGLPQAVVMTLIAQRTQRAA